MTYKLEVKSATCKTRQVLFIIFLFQKMHVSKSIIWQLESIRLMCLTLLPLTFVEGRSLLNFARNLVFSFVFTIKKKWIWWYITVWVVFLFNFLYILEPCVWFIVSDPKVDVKLTKKLLHYVNLWDRPDIAEKEVFKLENRDVLNILEVFVFNKANKDWSC